MNAVIRYPTTTLRLPASDRRRQLVETALDIFSRKGFGGTTTKEIAAAAGVTEAIIFRHFPTKQDLYNAVLDYHHDIRPKSPSASPSARPAWSATTTKASSAPSSKRIIEAYRRDPRVHRVLLFAALEGHETGLEHNRAAPSRSLSCFCQYVARRQREGAIRRCNPGRHHRGRRRHGHSLRQHDPDVRLLRQFHRSPDRRRFVDIVMHGIRPETNPLKRAQ